MGFRTTVFGYLEFRGSGSRIWVEGQEPEPVFDGLYDRGLDDTVDDIHPALPLARNIP